MKLTAGRRAIEQGTKRDRRREEIVQAATRLFRGGNYHDTSLEEIAAEIGLTKAALYYYFESKEEILFEIHQRLITLALEEVQAIAKGQGTPAERLQRMLRTHLDRVLEQRDANKVFYQEHGLHPPHRERGIRERQHAYEVIFRQVYDEGVRAEMFRPLDTTVAIAALLGACSWTYRWFRTDGRLSREEICDVMIDLLTAGYLAPQAVGSTAA